MSGIYMKLATSIVHKKGYTLLECLIALFILSLCLSLFSTYISYLDYLKVDDYNLQDEIGIYQLQITLAKNEIVSVENDEIVYKTYNNECLISLVNNRLISKPGTLIYLINIDEVSFEQEEEVIYLIYVRDEKEYRYPIALE